MSVSKDRSKSRLRLMWFHAAIFAAGMVTMACTQWLFKSANGPDMASTTPPKSNPWGELEITPLMLERPPKFLLTTNSWSSVIRWVFPKFSPQELAGFINSCDLTASQKTSLLNTNRWQPATNGWCILPPLEVVRDMSPSARRKIYSVLAESPENFPQQFAFFYRADGFDEWVGHSDLAPASIELVRKLCYVKDQRLCFADTQLFQMLTSAEETVRLVKTLARVPTLLMALKVTPHSDVDALIKYWGRLRKDGHVESFLRSMARVPGGASINVAYFMPAVPRLRLYTYSEEPGADRHDCFWTSFNFFNDRPDYDYSTQSQYNNLLRAGYERVQGEKMFGDLMLLLESGNTAAHMCVYIAEDAVYTKNGVDPKQPWVLMRLQDMMVLYASEKPQEWRVFRKRGL